LSERLSPLPPAALDDAQRALYREIIEGARAGQPFASTGAGGELLGPFDALLRVPELGQAVQRVGESLRFAGTLAPRLRELVVLAVAAHWDSGYEWYAHTRVAARLGVTDADLDALRCGAVPDSCDAAETAALGLAHGLLAERAVPPGPYRRAAAALGAAGLVEVACLVGYYGLLAGVLATFDVGAPAD
jgi:4-carboxymuconolactone decarboxylase